jgi:RNA polymerase sigma factor (sigma-70 family)
MGASAITPAASPQRRGPLAGISGRLLRVAPDEKLVALVRGGSQPAFEVLYDRHHRGILSFCRHMLGSREEAEDALQHTYMAAYKALLGSEKDIQLRAWLYTIARNRCLSILRARREQPSDDIEIPSTLGLATEVEQRAELRELLGDLAALPEEQRAALVLSEIGDLAHDDIAGILGCPRDKVKALVFQARSSLHQSRDARETSCQEIQEMLATLSGGALRRSSIRRHVSGCELCQAFESEVKRQRRALAAVLPVIPTLGLKESALGAVFGHSAAGIAGGAAAATVVAGGGATVAGSGATALVAKVLVVAAVAGGGAAGVDAVRSDHPASKGSARPPASAPALAPVAATTEASDPVATATATPGKKAKRPGDSARGKELAKKRGKGKKRGLNGTQPGKEKKAQAKARKQVKKQVSAERHTAKGNERAKDRTKTPVKKKPAKSKPVKTPNPAATPKPRPTPQGQGGNGNGKDKGSSPSEPTPTATP